MELVLDVETGGETRRVEVGIALTDNDDLIRVVKLCGGDALRRLASEEWSAEAAKAILYVNLVRALVDEPNWDNPPFTYEDFDLDWGDLESFMVDADPEMESALADLSEPIGEEE